MTNHPHNNFFEKVFSMPEVTRDFLEQLPPKEIRDILDLTELTLEDQSHISEGLRKTNSDLIFSSQLKTKHPVRVALLIEHKSNPPVNLHVQMNHYISSIHQQNTLAREPPIPVLPILFYHGRQKWKKKAFYETFPNLPKQLRRFIPNFDFILINLNDYSDEFILNLRDGFLKNALLVLKHSSDRTYLVNNAGKIFGGIENFSDGEQRKQLTEILASYFLHITELNLEEMNQINAQLPPETVQPFESTAQRLVREGKLEGKIEGKIEGEIKLLLKNINFCLSLMTHFPDLSMEEVANISGAKLTFAEKLQATFKDGNEEMARKTLLAIFKKYAKFQKLYLKEIEKMLTKYLPLFKA